MRIREFTTFLILTILLVSIFFINNSQFLRAFLRNSGSNSNDSVYKGSANSAQISSHNNQVSSGAQFLSPQISTISRDSSSSMNNTMIGRATATNPSSELTPSNLTTSLDSIISPKALLASAIDQIRNSTTKIIRSDNQTSSTIFVRNPWTMLLSHQIIPPKDFILVYDTIGYKIISGQVYAKLPCDSNSKSSLQVLIGQLSKLGPAQLQLISGLSKPGYMCVYYADLTSNNNTTAIVTKSASNEAKNHSASEVVSRAGNLTITNIELLNPTAYQVILPDTSSLSISVNQISR